MPEGSTGNLGWDSDIGYVIWIAGSWQPISGEAVNCMVAAFAADFEKKSWAQFIEDLGLLSNYDPYLPLNMQEDKIIELGGKKYRITFDHINTREAGMREFQLTVTLVRPFTVRDAITACDDFATLTSYLSLVPGFQASWGISVVFGTTGMVITYNEYKSGNMSKIEMGRAFINWIVGLVPGKCSIAGNSIQSSIDHGLWDSVINWLFK